MFDEPIRRLVSRGLGGAAGSLLRVGLAPSHLTGVGLVLAIAAGATVAFGHPVPGLGIWLLSRVPDALDGLMARLGDRVTPFGSYLDATADMAAYSLMLVGFAASNSQFGIVWALILAGYVLCSTSTLALSSLLERLDREFPGGNRSILFTRGLAEAGETTAVYVLFVLVPSYMGTVAWIWAVMLGVTALQRTLLARRLLRS